MHKTGSTAFLAALREAGYADAMRIHALGPRSRASLARIHGRVEPAVETGDSSVLKKRLSDPDQTFAIVTCIRDPIAQLISKYFQFLADRPASCNQDLDGMIFDFIAWVETHIGMTFQQDWFQDNIDDALGLDVFGRRFDRPSYSLRLHTSRMRLLCLRHEDQTPCKELGLGWLLGNDGVRLRTQNATTDKPDGDRYVAFRAAFAPPRSWLDAMYDTAIVRHVYTDFEIAEMRSRWLSTPK